MHELEHDLERNKLIAYYSMLSSLTPIQRHHIKMAAYKDTLDILFMRQQDPYYGEHELVDISKVIPLDS